MQFGTKATRARHINQIDIRFSQCITIARTKQHQFIIDFTRLTTRIEQFQSIFRLLHQINGLIAWNLFRQFQRAAAIYTKRETKSVVNCIGARAKISIFHPDVEIQIPDLTVAKQTPTNINEKITNFRILRRSSMIEHTTITKRLEV